MTDHIFISYSRNDKKWLDRLLPILKQAHVHLGFEYWSDTLIEVSDDWNAEINKALENSVAAIIIVSGDFLGSEFIKQVEIEGVIKKSIPIFPLLVSDCLWNKIEWLSKIQMFPNAPVLPLDSIQDAAEQNKLLLQFVEGVVDKLKPSREPTTSSAAVKHPEATAKGAGEPFGENTIILNVDIRNFTLMKLEAQPDAIVALWNSLEPDLRPLPRRNIIPHEDGVVLLFPIQPATHQQVMTLVGALLKSLAAKGVHLRAAVHQGYVSRVRVASFVQPLVFGNAINDCHKLCSFSEDEHFVVSEAFLEGWQSLGTANFDNLFPGRGKGPIKIMLKEDRDIGIRFAGKTDGKPPQRILFLEAVAREIKGSLKLIELCLIDFLKESGLDNARRIASPRISIFYPVNSHGKLVLAASSFRFHFAGKDTKPGSTFYDVEPPGAGTCGRAFVSGKVQIAVGFPDYRTHPKEYIERWQKKWGMEKEHVQDFSRKSRAVMSIPMKIGDLPTLGVLCIDSIHPFTEIKKIRPALLRKFCQAISDDFVGELSLLWIHLMHH